MIKNTQKIEKSLLQYAYNVLMTESQAIKNLINDLDQSFDQAINMLVGCKGKVIIIGVGKSGHIANKIASTFASTGTPAFFIHPTEAAHGDIGMISSDDIVLFLSHSGKSTEILNLIPYLKKKNIFIITITSNKNSHIASLSDINLLYNIQKEACPLGLAPTVSTAVALALGDALAVCLLQLKNFTSNDFALRHPAGALGKKLLLTVNDIMHTGNDLPTSHVQDLLKDAIITISEKRLGFIAVEDNNRPVGIFTDGDLRRLFQKKTDHFNLTMQEIMNKNPISINSHELVITALDIMRDKQINALLVINSHNQLIGALNIHDIISCGIL